MFENEIFDDERDELDKLLFGIDEQEAYLSFESAVRRRPFYCRGSAPDPQRIRDFEPRVGCWYVIQGGDNLIKIADRSLNYISCRRGSGKPTALQYATIINHNKRNNVFFSNRKSKAFPISMFPDGNISNAFLGMWNKSRRGGEGRYFGMIFLPKLRGCNSI